eukprot:6202196-Pleurochrysis_carterae.AAC.1
MVSMILLTAAAGASGAIMRVPRSAATMASTRMVRTSVAMARNRSGGAQLCANEAPANDHALSAISADGSISVCAASRHKCRTLLAFKCALCCLSLHFKTLQVSARRHACCRLSSIMWHALAANWHRGESPLNALQSGDVARACLVEK